MSFMHESNVDDGLSRQNCQSSDAKQLGKCLQRMLMQPSAKVNSAQPAI